MRLLIATNNPHKRNEFAAIFTGYRVVSPADIGLTFSAEETGETFLENALIKGRGLREALASAGASVSDESTAIVADDSGLCVDALGGGPGVYSARFGSPDGGRTELDAASRNELLLQAIETAETRSAHFVCCMVALLSRDRVLVAQESWQGEVASRPSQSGGGFGYDPVFSLPQLGCTAADLSPEEKNRLSHRGRASRVLLAALHEAGRQPGEA